MVINWKIEIYINQIRCIYTMTIKPDQQVIYSCKNYLMWPRQSLADQEQLQAPGSCVQLFIGDHKVSDH